MKKNKKTNMIGFRLSEKDTKKLERYAEKKQWTISYSVSYWMSKILNSSKIK